MMINKNKMEIDLESGLSKTLVQSKSNLMLMQVMLLIIFLD